MEVVMAYHFEYDPDLCILLVVVEGEINQDDIFSYHEEIKTKLDSHKVKAAITDLSGVEKSDLPSHMVWELASRDALLLRKVPRIIVAPQSYLYGMARMYQLSANIPSELLEIVHTRDEALAAMGAKNARFQRLKPPEGRAKFSSA